MKADDLRGVLLPDNETGSGFFHRVLGETAAKFSSELGNARIPEDARVFKRTYGDDLVRFESARLRSGKRVAIARHLTEATLGSLRLSEGGKTGPLRERLDDRAEAPKTEAQKIERTGEPGLSLEVPFEGKVWRGRELLDLVVKLYADHHITAVARDGVRWLVEHVETAGGRLDLRGQRFAILGAAAELSPAPLLLAAGATVLWIDRTSPERTLAERKDLAGTVIHVPAGDDLLAAPRTALAAIRRFAEEGEGPVHVGLFAYAPGASRELRIAAVMDAMVKRLGPDVVKTLSLFISPTSPGEMQPEDRRVAADRLTAHPAWQKALALARVLQRPAHYGDDDATVCRAIMTMQGPGYQAAQYLCKIASCEALAIDGLDPKKASPFTVSANVAGITNTRSLAHPLFQLGFVGAPLFGVRIWDPETTRALSTLLMLHDLLNPEAPAAATRTHATEDDRARAVRSSQIHGGVYDMPWQFQSAVQAAAVIGMGRRPDILLRRKKRPARA